MDNLDIDREQQAYEYENGFHLRSGIDSAVNVFQNTINQITEAVKNGFIDSLEAFATIRQITNISDKAIKYLESQAIEEANKHGKTFEKYGYKFTYSEGTKSFDFSNIQEVTELEEKLKQLKEKYKAVYLAEEKGLITVDSTSEILQKPIVKYSKSSIKVVKA